MNDVNEPIKLYAITLRTIKFYNWKKCDSPLGALRLTLPSFFTAVDMVVVGVVCVKKTTLFFAVWLGRRLSNTPWLNWTQTVTTKAHKNTMAPSAIAEVHFLLDISSAKKKVSKMIIYATSAKRILHPKRKTSIYKDA